MAAVHIRPDDPRREVALLTSSRLGQTRQERDDFVDLQPELLLVDDRAGDRLPAGDLLLGQGFGPVQSFLQPLNRGGVPRVVRVGMRPAEITNATRHVELATNTEIHTTLPSNGCATCVGLPDTVDSDRGGEDCAT